MNEWRHYLGDHGESDEVAQRAHGSDEHLPVALPQHVREFIDDSGDEPFHADKLQNNH